MSAYEDIKLEGHIIDSLLLPQVLDDILERGGEYRILRFRWGARRTTTPWPSCGSRRTDEEQLDAILRDLQQHGVELVEQDDVRLEAAPADGVFPEDFYSTTNLETFVRLDGRWIPVEWPEMDCGIVVDAAAGTARTVPLIQVQAGDLFVVGTRGIRVVPLGRDRASRAFEFMGSAVSSEKPKRLVVAQVARLMREIRAKARRSWLCWDRPWSTPAPPRPSPSWWPAGWIDVVFGGNAVAVARHRVGLLRHLAGHQPDRGRIGRRRPRASSARHQPHPPLRRHPPGGGAGRAHFGPVLRDRAAGDPLRAGRLHPR